jgi:hypothetical protein
MGYALGVYHYTHESVMLSAAVVWSKDGWEKAGRMGITWWAGSSKVKDKAVTDNTITGTNVPALAPVSPSSTPAKTRTGSDNIMDRVNRLLATNGAD